MSETMATCVICGVSVNPTYATHNCTSMTGGLARGWQCQSCGRLHSTGPCDPQAIITFALASHKCENVIAIQSQLNDALLRNAKLWELLEHEINGSYPCSYGCEPGGYQACSGCDARVKALKKG